MKLASFIRNGAIDCGALMDGGIAVFDGHPTLGKMPSHQRLFAILAMEHDQRRELTAWAAKGRHIATDSVKMLPAVPLCPLYFYLHGNNPTLCKRQNGPGWQLTRVPYARVRTFSSLSGHDWDVLVPPGGKLFMGPELAVVIGRTARRVTPDNALDHIAALVCTNDLAILELHEEWRDKSSPASEADQNHGMDTIFKNADNDGGMGPWLVTAEELEDRMRARVAPLVMQRYADRHLAAWIYHRTMAARLDGELVDETRADSYLLGPEWLVSYISRFMMLPVGTVLGFGSAGWDGLPSDPSAEPGSTRTIELEMQDVGTMRQTPRRMAASQRDQSPCLAAWASRGMDPLAADFPRPSPALWAMQGNYPEVQASEGRPPVQHINPLLYPATAMGAEGAPIVLPPCAMTIKCSVHLAAVIGAKPAYHVQGAAALAYIGRIAPMLSIRDSSMQEAIKEPSGYEWRGANFLSRCGEGYFRLGPGRPLDQVGKLDELTLSLELPGQPPATYNTGRYLYGFEQALTAITRLITLMPGDIVSLGPVGAELVLPPETKATWIRAGNSWGAAMEFTFDDQRDPAAREKQR